MIGTRIKKLREMKGLSITELAKLAGVSKSYLSQIERGLQSNPSLQFLYKLSAPLETTIEYLLEDIKIPSPCNMELDEEWKSLINQAIAQGLKKEDFLEYRNFIKFQAWLSQKEEK